MTLKFIQPWILHWFSSLFQFSHRPDLQTQTTIENFKNRTLLNRNLNSLRNHKRINTTEFSRPCGSKTKESQRKTKSRSKSAIWLWNSMQTWCKAPLVHPSKFLIIFFSLHNIGFRVCIKILFCNYQFFFSVLNYQVDIFFLDQFQILFSLLFQILCFQTPFRFT